jgi:hypothetical protein
VGGCGGEQRACEHGIVQGLRHTHTHAQTASSNTKTKTHTSQRCGADGPVGSGGKHAPDGAGEPMHSPQLGVGQGKTTTQGRDTHVLTRPDVAAVINGTLVVVAHEREIGVEREGGREGDGSD